MDKQFWSRESVWFYVSLFLAAVLVFQAGMWYQSSVNTAEPAFQEAKGNQPSADNEQPRAQNSPERPSTTEDSLGNTPQAGELVSVPDWTENLLTNSREKSLGSPDAPVTVVEYLDLECPFCRKYNKNAFPKLLENYIKTGKVYYKVRHYPLSMHERAVPAGNAAECAAEQGKFWAFKYVVMNSEVSLDQQSFIRVARNIGVSNPNGFEQCVKNGTPKEKVRQEQQAGAQKGVRATPTVFIGDEKIVGAQSFSRYKQVIDRQLE